MASRSSSAERVEHDLLHQVGEGSPHGIDHQRFGDLVAPPGIAIDAARLGNHGDGRRIRRGHAVEDLGQVRHLIADRIAEEPGHADSRRHAEEPAQGDGMALVETILRHLPRSEARMDVGVEVEALRLDEPHRADRGHEFRERRGLIDRLGRRACAIGLRECDAVAVDQREADRRDIEGGHRFFERQRLVDAVHRDDEIALERRRLNS
jgi:hypothetical protein